MFRHSRYYPKIGDLVNYKDELMVIVSVDFISMDGDYAAYLLNKELLKDFKDFTDTKYLFSQCILLKYNIFNRFYPFTPIGTIPIKIEQVSYIKIQLKE